MPNDEKISLIPDLVGLDERPRPKSARERILLGLKQSAPFSSLQRRIIFFNLVGLAFLVLGVLYLNQFRSGLIEQRVDALRTQGEIIAITIAETAGVNATEPGFDPVRANLVLNRLVHPTGLRARLYDRRLRLTGDTRSLQNSGAQIEVKPIGPPGGVESISNDTLTWLERLYRKVSEVFGSSTPVYSEVPQAGISREVEVANAVRGYVSSSARLNSQDELIVSVAVPIKRFQAVLGALVLSTEGGDIDTIVRNERSVILQVFVVAAMVSVGLSILLAHTIAAPIRKLAAAAENEGTNASRPLNPDRVEIPDMTYRTDEIGELSAALIRMTEALYKRIEAIESFASDVAHEIKNPLTSMRSAVETMSYAKTPEQRQRLLDVIQMDVGRLDRLVTDISNASRLDAELVREKMQPFDLGNLIGMLASVTEAQAEERRVKVVTHLPPRGLMARGLEGRLAQVITNLLDNALSFSPKNATISVFAEQVGTKIRVRVEDQGPGIPPDNIGSIFERFYTERPDPEAFGTHSGLGLSISRQIIEAHSGRIWAENIHSPDDEEGDPPDGARFIFEIPA